MTDASGNIQYSDRSHFAISVHRGFFKKIYCKKKKKSKKNSHKAREAEAKQQEPTWDAS